MEGVVLAQWLDVGGGGWRLGWWGLAVKEVVWLLVSGSGGVVG